VEGAGQLTEENAAMAIEFLHAVPLLRIFDVAKAREFYVGWLGFTIDWEHRFDARAPLYMQISRAGLVLHLTEHHGDCCPGSTVFVRMRGIHELHRELEAKGYGYMRPAVEPTGHGSLGLHVTDPFGNRIRFDESV
jgi:catechol 2,3-dioxygenase-like lactoylglutathione lyase family enzyme